MKKVSLITFAVAVAIMGLTAAPACAAVEVQIADPSGTHVYTGVSCGANCTSVVASDGDASFSIDIQLGSSDIVNGLPSLKIAGLVYANHAGSLSVEISNTDFTAPLGIGQLTQTVGTLYPGSFAAAGDLTAQGFYGIDAGNTYFCSESNTCAGDTPAIGISSFQTSSDSSSYADANLVSSYSLDEILDYTFTGAGLADAGAVLSVMPSVAPEPASVALVGVTLLAAGLLFRRKNNHTRG